MIGRREFCRLGAASVAAALLPAAGCTAAGPLRIAAHAWPGYEFLRLGQAFGWTSPGQVALTRTSGFLASIDALERGTADAAALTLDDVLRLREKGLPASIVLVFDISAGADVLLSAPAIRTLPALRGRRIGVEASGLGEIMLAKVLEAAGLQRAEVVIVPMQDDHLTTWRTGELDAILTYEPWLTQLEKTGLVHLFDSRRVPQMIVDVLAVRAEARESRGRELRAAIESHFRALRRWHENPVDTSYHLAAQLDIAPEETAKVLRGLDLPDAAYNRQYLSPPAADLTHAAREVAAIMRAAGMLRGPAKLDGLFVPDFLPGERL